MDVQTVGFNIEKRRRLLGLTQEDLAEMSNITVRSIYDLEHGRANPSYNTLVKICTILGLEIIVKIKGV